MCKIGNEILVAEICHQIRIPRRALQLIVKGKRLVKMPQTRWFSQLLEDTKKRGQMDEIKKERLSRQKGCGDVPLFTHIKWQWFWKKNRTYMKVNFLCMKSKLKQTFYAVFDASLVTTLLNEGPLSVTEMMESFA